MILSEALSNVSTLFLDTALIIYFVERNPHFFITVKGFFEHIDAGSIEAVTSPITLSECLVIPHRQDNLQLQQDFQELIVYGQHTRFVNINHSIGVRAAQLRAVYNYTLPDVLQLATALESGCDAFLTNDKTLSNTAEIKVIVLDDIEPAS